VFPWYRGLGRGVCLTRAVTVGSAEARVFYLSTLLLDVFRSSAAAVDDRLDVRSIGGSVIRHTALMTNSANA
jgi:hypothetical protein